MVSSSTSTTTPTSTHLFSFLKSLSKRTPASPQPATSAAPAAVAAATTTAVVTPRHTRFEDAQALFAGSLFVGIAMMMFAQAGLLTGSTAGLAFVLHYATGWSFGLIYFVINLPFYWFAWSRIGHAFTIKTFVCVAMLSVITAFGPRFLHIDYLHPLFAAIAGGLLMGTGVLFMARHKSSLGGATIVSLYSQDRWKIPAGKVQMSIDVAVVLLALCVVSWQRVAWSILAAVVMSVFLWVSHRPGRYNGR